MDCLRLNPDSILQCDLCLISYSQKIGIKNETMNARHSVLSKCSTNFMYLSVYLSLVVSSAGKKSTCNAGDPGLIPGLGRCLEEGIRYPLQYSWASVVAQMIKNSTAIWETWVWFLGWEDPLEEGMATHFSTLAWRIPMDRGAWWITVHGSQTAGHDRATKHTHTYQEWPQNNSHKVPSTFI